MALVSDLQIGKMVQIIQTDNVMQRFPHFVGHHCVILGVPVHPSTWFTVKIENTETVVKLQPTALKIVTDHARKDQKSIASGKALKFKSIGVESPKKFQNSRPRSNSQSAFAMDSRVLILETDNSLQRAPHVVGQVGTVKEVPMHPATWYKIQFSDGEMVTLRPSALQAVEDELDSDEILNSDTVATKQVVNKAKRLSRDSKVDHDKLSQETNEEQDEDSSHDQSAAMDVIDGAAMHDDVAENSASAVAASREDTDDIAIAVTAGGAEGDSSAADTGQSSRVSCSKSELLSQLDPDLWVGRQVRILGGRLNSQLGVVARSGNGWVQVDTATGEVAKRAHELQVLKSVAAPAAQVAGGAVTLSSMTSATSSSAATSSSLPRSASLSVTAAVSHSHTIIARPRSLSASSSGAAASAGAGAGVGVTGKSQATADHSRADTVTAASPLELHKKTSRSNGNCSSKPVVDKEGATGTGTGRSRVSRSEIKSLTQHSHPHNDPDEDTAEFAIQTSTIVRSTRRSGAGLATVSNHDTSSSSSSASMPPPHKRERDDKEDVETGILKPEKFRRSVAAHSSSSAAATAASSSSLAARVGNKRLNKGHDVHDNSDAASTTATTRGGTVTATTAASSVVEGEISVISSRMKAARTSVFQRYVDRQSEIIKTRPDLSYWHQQLQGVMTQPDCESQHARELDSDVIQVCRTCRMEKWPAAKYCWNQNCESSPVYWELPGARGHRLSPTHTSSYNNSTGNNSRSNNNNFKKISNNSNTITNGAIIHNPVPVTVAAVQSAASGRAEEMIEIAVARARGSSRPNAVTEFLWQAPQVIVGVQQREQRDRLRGECVINATQDEQLQFNYSDCKSNNNNNNNNSNDGNNC